MRPSGLFGARKVRPAWNYTVKGVIWHIHPAAGAMLIGEERRIEEKKAFFFCLDRGNGREVWRQASPADAWWVGIEAVYEDTVLFHGFANPNLPQHRGIFAADVLTGKKLWEDQDLEFKGIADGAVVGSKETSAGSVATMLDRRSGAKRGDLGTVDLQSLELARTYLAEEIKLPVALDQLSPRDAQIEAVVKNHYDAGNLAGTPEAVQHSGYVIFDYHRVSGQGTATNPILSSVVSVVDRLGETLAYSDTICTGAQAITPNLFFVLQDMLYYIKERRTLMAVHLAS